MNLKPVAIIGAGLCGLTLARRLYSLNRPSILIEKSKGVGGRLATRRDAESTYDHGAAFYENSEPQKIIWHNTWQKNNKSKLWFTENNTQFFCGSSGMTSLAKDLAADQNIQTNEKVLSFGKLTDGINIFCQSGKIIHAQSIVLTSPLPQSLEILEKSEIDYPSTLKTISYSKAIVGLFELEPKPGLYDFNFLKPGGPILSIANNQAKGISQNLALTVVMDQAWSDANFDLEDSQNLELVKTELQKLFKGLCIINRMQIKKWRYSLPQSVYSQKCAVLSGGSVFLAGDAFGGPNLAGAVSSAEAVFGEILK